MQDNLQNQNIPPIRSQPIENPVEIKRKWIKISLFVLIGVLVVAALATAGYVYFKTVKPSLTPIKESAKKEWVGVIATNEGLIKINSQGVKGKEPFLPPGITRDFFKSLTDYDDDRRNKFMNLLEDGRLVFVGSREITSAPNRNTIYYWDIEGNDDPKIMLEIAEGQKIQSFAVSPDGKQLAVISVSRPEEELYEGLGNLDAAQKEKTLVERAKELREQNATIFIYDLENKQLKNTLKLKNGEADRNSAGKLVWRKVGLFVLELSEINVFNPSNGEMIENIKDVAWLEGRLQSLSETIVISPDGSKYYNSTTGEVRKIPGNQTIAKLNAPEFIPPELVNEKADLEKQIVLVGPSAFSPDSKRVIVQGGSVNLTNFMVWEINIENNTTQKLGDIDTMGIRLHPKGQISLSGGGYYFTFISYHPSGKEILFSLFAGTQHGQNPTDLFWLRLSEQKTNRIPISLSAFNLRDISFLGWYLSPI